jgi:hypothetical protein
MAASTADLREVMLDVLRDREVAQHISAAALRDEAADLVITWRINVVAKRPLEQLIFRYGT